MFILITGGAGSGKSAHAERLVCAAAPDTRLYLATMEPGGPAAQGRITRHRALRQGKGFVTVERTVDLGGLSLPTRYQGILLEDLGNLTANELFAPTGAAHRMEPRSAADAPEEAGLPVGEDATQAVVLAIQSGIRHLREQGDTLVVVTNEVFADGLPYASDTVRYVRTLGQLNRALCAEADAVYESVCGILVPWREPGHEPGDPSGRRSGDPPRKEEPL